MPGTVVEWLREVKGRELDAGLRAAFADWLEEHPHRRVRERLDTWLDVEGGLWVGRRRGT